MGRLPFLNSHPNNGAFRSDTLLRMKPEKTVEVLLRWHLEHAKAEAPPAPSASHLLEIVRSSEKNRQKCFNRKLNH
jgi:hypothetical protein